MLMFFGGFLIRLADIPRWWYWFSYINPIRYAWTALMVNQFRVDPRFIGGRTLLEYYGVKGQSAWCA
jgi:ABC-type multidrug transport system permease subunit